MTNITIKITDAQELTLQFLHKLGMSQDESLLIMRNLIAAELTGKSTHGLIRLMAFQKKSLQNKLNKSDTPLVILNVTPTSLYIDGQKKLGYLPIYKSLTLAIEKVKQSKMVCVGIKNIGMSGYIGDYAHMVTNHNCIFIGFNNSPKGLVPHGAKRGIWGTNPLTIGVPTHDIPVILDMASTQTTWGNLMLATSKGQSLEAGVAIDAEGSPTVDPSLAALGGLLPFAGPKGSGLGFIIELLAGALTGSRVGCSVPGEGGCFYIVIDPTLFRDLKEFKDDIQTAIKELKSTPRANGFHEIFYTGEQSQKRRLESLKVGSIIIDQEIYNSVLNFVEHNPKNI